MVNNKLESEVEMVDEVVSYREGFSFDFTDADHNISVRCSSITGKETVYVDDNLVAEKRSFRRKSSMNFNIGEDSYEVEFNVVNMLKGETHCTLIKNEAHLKTIKKALLKKNQLTGKNIWIKLPLYFVCGAICGSLAAKYLPILFGG